MSNQIKRVVVLGGGTAGWMSASYIAKAFQGHIDVTLMEAPTVPRIGVGEATVPNLQKVFFDFLGIPEEEWMRECNASYKMGIKFVNWRTPGVGQPDPRKTDNGSDHYYHLFGLLPAHERLPLSQYWFHKKYHNQVDEPFDYACYREPPAMDANLAPRYADGTKWTNYAWHFDAQLVANFLARFSKENLGVRHIEDELTHVSRDHRGFITAIHTKGGRTIEGDLFVDCSGFRALLINGAMREPFLDMSDYLLCDSAVASAVPDDDPERGVEPFTSAIAMSSGWTWKIPILGRFGTGYVFSERFQSRDDATREFCDLWGLDPEKADLNQIRFRVGRNRRTWVKNCVAIGLSSCFLEPLESTGIYFIYAAVYQLVKHFPNMDFDPILIDRFNEEINTMFDDSRDFIQAHFYVSPRTDTAFWRENKKLQLSDAMQEKMAMYRSGMPVNLPITDENTYYDNFDAEFRNFWNNSNFYCIFAGLGYDPEHPLPALEHRPDQVEGAERIFERVAREQKELTRTLPSCYEYLTKLHGRTGTP